MLKCFRRLEIENLYKKVNHEVAWGGSYINYVSIGKFNHRDAFFVVKVIDFRNRPLKFFTFFACLTVESFLLGNINFCKNLLM